MSLSVISHKLQIINADLLLGYKSNFQYLYRLQICYGFIEFEIIVSVHISFEYTKYFCALNKTNFF